MGVVCKGRGEMRGGREMSGIRMYDMKPTKKINKRKKRDLEAAPDKEHLLPTWANKVAKQRVKAWSLCLHSVPVTFTLD